MNTRRTMMARRAMTAVVITTGLALTVAGCGGGGENGKSDKSSSPKSSASKGKDDEEGSSQAPEAEEVLAEVKSNGITLSVTSVSRDEGGFLTVNGKVTNGTSGIWVGSEWRSDENELKKNGGSLAGASVIDQQGKKRYLVLRDTTGRCLCTKFEGGVDEGQTVEWFAQFPAPPEGTAKVQFQVPTMPPAPIEISEGE
ncbi:Lipoprotein OS=Streptomyces alboniger OX=132473 GN=CP975_22475 PE=4 SV=1 [Streptomyces alboniger]